MPASYQLRPYEPSDYPILKQFLEARDKQAPHESWLETEGFTCFRQDDPTHDPRIVGFGFLYLTNSCGVGHLDWFTTHPNLPLYEAREITNAILYACEHVGKSLFPEDFVMIGSVQSEAMARATKAVGFIPTGQVQMILKPVGK